MLATKRVIGFLLILSILTIAPVSGNIEPNNMILSRELTESDMEKTIEYNITVPDYIDGTVYIQYTLLHSSNTEEAIFVTTDPTMVYQQDFDGVTTVQWDMLAYYALDDLFYSNSYDDYWADSNIYYSTGAYNYLRVLFGIYISGTGSDPSAEASTGSWSYSSTFEIKIVESAKAIAEIGNELSNNGWYYVGGVVLITGIYIILRLRRANYI